MPLAPPKDDRDALTHVKARGLSGARPPGGPGQRVSFTQGETCGCLGDLCVQLPAAGSGSVLYGQPKAQGGSSSSRDAQGGLKHGPGGSKVQASARPPASMHVRERVPLEKGKAAPRPGDVREGGLWTSEGHVQTSPLPAGPSVR